MRRPTRFGDSAAQLAEATPAEVAAVIDVFREPGRSFLMPPVGEPLTAETVVDISHESLMRVWKRLNAWADEEAQSAQTYRRLAETGSSTRGRQAGLWRDPDLQLALQLARAEPAERDLGRALPSRLCRGDAFPGAIGRRSRAQPASGPP